MAYDYSLVIKLIRLLYHYFRDMKIEQEIPLEEYRDKQLHLPFIEELEEILSIHPEMVEFVIHPHNDMVDVKLGWTTYCIITKKQYHLLADDEPSLDWSLNKDDLQK